MWGLFNDVENLFSLHFSDSFERFGKLFLGRVAITFWHNSLKIVSLAPVLFYRSREMKKLSQECALQKFCPKTKPLAKEMAILGPNAAQRRDQ